jgi:pimeloyl-ACP methyl ester carboxylesterase
MVAPVENDLLGYQLALELAKEKQDAKALTELEKIGPPPYGKGAAMKYSKITTPGFSYMAEKVGRKENGRNNMSYLLNPQEYQLSDKINVLRGLRAGMDNIYPQLDQVDFIKQAVKLRVPVYFMSGVYDVNTFSTQVEKYYQALIAPHKKLIWFGQSGHSPCFEEPERFNQLMVKIVLAETYDQKLQSQLLFGRLLNER